MSDINPHGDEQRLKELLPTMRDNGLCANQLKADFRNETHLRKVGSSLERE
jgi:hypothetical protein